MARIAVVAYPVFDESTLNWIESIRAEHDPQAGRIPPHFTLVFPVAASPTNISREITAVTIRSAPIVFVIRSAVAMADVVHGGGHVFLIPGEGRDEIARLRDELYAGVLRPHLREDIPFVPHITIAANADVGWCGAYAQELTRMLQPLRGIVETVTVIDVDVPKVESIQEFALSGKQGGSRPFYAEFAWAFDLIIDRPVQKECAVIAAWLADRGIFPGATLLDAGCGTGRYAVELARRGYVVTGIDRSPDLIGVARASGVEARSSASFDVGDITNLPAAQYSAILCRGVLNDIVKDADRDAVMVAFARALRPNGTLILDVREWNASAQRKAREPVFRKRVSTERGELTFTSVTRLDRENRQLLLSERHELVAAGGNQVDDFDFVMRCWEREELGSLLERHGFTSVSYFGAYDPDVEIGATDRLVALASGA